MPLYTPPFFIFLLTLSACALLVLVTFSMPFIQVFYFLDASIDGGIRFGIWGWCMDANGECTPKKYGYRFDPELIPVLTKLFIFYPISAALSFISALCLLPVMCTRQYHWYPFPLFSFLSLLSFLTSGAALAVSVVIWVVAISRFEKEGFTASLTSGPCIWMSLGATAALLLVALNAAGGHCCGYMGRRTHRAAYNY